MCPKLDETTSGEVPATLRERLAQHRADPACANCHSRIDPLGFALENFDVLGRWRTEDAGKPIDAKGELPDGTVFDGPDQLKAALMRKKDLFVRNFVNKMLGYALGRGLTLQDSCTVDSIVAEVERNNYRAQSLVNAVVMSVPFRYQGAPAPSAGPQAGPAKSTATGEEAMMIPRQKPLSRRTVLRGAGVALGLPWLEAMAPSALAASAPADTKSPVRMAVLYMANGVNTSQWTPEGRGRDFGLSPTLKPLEDLKDQLLVVDNLWNAAANTGDGHYTKESSLLTCTTITKTLGVDINIHGPSMDQVAAQRVGAETPLPSLELGIEPESTGVDANVGYTRVYGCHIAWSGPKTPLARETNPRSVYARLFRAASPAGDSAKQDTLLLDRVLEQSKKMRRATRRRRPGPRR